MILRSRYSGHEYITRLTLDASIKAYFQHHIP